MATEPSLQPQTDRGQPATQSIQRAQFCGWLFFDASRNRSRRWCSMEDCGNRAKARLHYKRHKVA
ncbi:MAG: CGNR zinc finger domain-containing protein [Caldilinea sp.]|nr:CGNR zinc finger domain-containing protein [Caldilinea sp.]